MSGSLRLGTFSALFVVTCVLVLPRSGSADLASVGKSAKTRVLKLPDSPYHYTDDELPLFYSTPEVRRFDNTPRDNRITDAGATLGRVLFYDTRLSANGTVACASCHQQKHAFGDPRRFSKGFAGKETDRHAMPLVDARYYAPGRFFWDERAATLEEQVLGPIQNKTEMGQELGRLNDILAKDPAYPALFAKAFGDPAVTTNRTAKALAQFVRAMVSYRSKYDVGLAKVSTVQDNFPNFTGQENQGKGVFLRRCGTCHLPPSGGAILSTQMAQNNGLDAGVRVADLGVADVTMSRFQAGFFKSPSLRNIEVTGPYMHDGRFATLPQVIEHYSSGIQSHPNLDPRLRGRPRLDPVEKNALLAFLKTLTDQAFMTDPKFSDPFVTK